MKKTLFILIMLPLLTPSKVLACSYEYPGNAVEMIEKADVVFAGVVNEAEPFRSIEEVERKTVNGIVVDTKKRWSPYLSVKMKPVKVFKGHVDDTVTVIHDVQCDGNIWLQEKGKMRVIVGSGDGDTTFMMLGQNLNTQKVFIDYLEKGIEPEMDCSAVTRPDAEAIREAKQYKVRCHKLPHDIEDPFRFIPPKAAQ